MALKMEDINYQDIKDLIETNERGPNIEEKGTNAIILMSIIVSIQIRDRLDTLIKQPEQDRLHITTESRPRCVHK